MVKRNQKGYAYGLILNQEKYPVKVHRPIERRGLVRMGEPPHDQLVWADYLDAACGAGVSQSRVILEDRRNRIEVAHRLLDGEATVYCAKCYPKKGTT